MRYLLLSSLHFIRYPFFTLLSFDNVLICSHNISYLLYFMTVYPIYFALFISLILHSYDIFIYYYTCLTSVNITLLFYIFCSFVFFFFHYLTVDGFFFIIFCSHHLFILYCFNDASLYSTISLSSFYDTIRCRLLILYHLFTFHALDNVFSHSSSITGRPMSFFKISITFLYMTSLHITLFW